MADQELTEFIITRLAELTVVVIEDYVGRDAGALKDRAEARDILVGLGNYAAKHGRPDIAQVLGALAAKIEIIEQRDRLEPPQAIAPGRTTLRYRW